MLQQLEEERITIFALQETRLRKLHQTQHPDFFILKAAATDAGHGGVLNWCLPQAALWEDEVDLLYDSETSLLPRQPPEDCGI